jgi:hypothetical protein
VPVILIKQSILFKFREIKILVDLFNQIRKKLVIFVHFKGFNISQKPKSRYFALFISQALVSGRKNIPRYWYI